MLTINPIGIHGHNKPKATVEAGQQFRCFRIKIEFAIGPLRIRSRLLQSRTAVGTTTYHVTHHPQEILNATHAATIKNHLRTRRFDDSDFRFSYVVMIDCC